MRVMFVGAKAQARLSHNILRRKGHTVPIIFDRAEGTPPPWDCKVFSDPEMFDSFARTCEGFVVCIGGNTARIALIIPIASKHSGSGPY